MEKSLILKEIFDQNKHWKSDNSFFEEKKHKRKLFFEILKYLKDRQIISIMGLRRTGKTIILKQLIKYLIQSEKINPERILFLSFDEALITSKLTLKDYLDVYFDEIIKNDFGKTAYIFLDEIQYVHKWQHILKRYYDLYRNLKIIISGSSSLFLKKKTTESLAGRIYEFVLPPLNFEEFLEISGSEKELISEYRKYAVNAGQINIEMLAENYEKFIYQRGNELEKKFEEYVILYQFPEMIGETDPDKIRKYIADSIYRKAVEYDIPRIFGIDKIDELKFVFQMLVNENGSILEFKNISSEAGIEKNTLKKYIQYFQDSFLINIVYNYSKLFRKSKRLQKKVYIPSTNFYSLNHPELFKDPVLRLEHLGKLAETYFFNLLRQKYQYVSFFRKGSEELDFVAADDILDKKSYRLIEVKYSNKLKRNDFRFAKKAAKIFKKEKYLVYSKNSFGIEKDKIIIPCYLIK